MRGWDKRGIVRVFAFCAFFAFSHFSFLFSFARMIHSFCIPDCPALWPLAHQIAGHPSYTLIFNTHTLSFPTQIHFHVQHQFIVISTLTRSPFQCQCPLVCNTNTFTFSTHQHMLILSTNTFSFSTQIHDHVQRSRALMFNTNTCVEKGTSDVLNKGLSVSWNQILFPCAEQVSIGVQKTSVNRCAEKYVSLSWTSVGRRLNRCFEKVFICVLKKCLSVFRRSVYPCSEKECIGVLKTFLSGFWKMVYRCSEEVSIGVNEKCEKCENAKMRKNAKMRNM